MQEMSCIEEFYLSANTLQRSLTSEIMCSSLQKNMHCPDTFSKVLLGGGRWGEKMQKEKKNLHSILRLQKAFRIHFCIATMFSFVIMLSHEI